MLIVFHWNSIMNLIVVAIRMQFQRLVLDAASFLPTKCNVSFNYHAMSVWESHVSAGIHNAQSPNISHAAHIKTRCII